MLRGRELLHWAFFNRPIVLALLMLTALGALLYLVYDGFLHRYEEYGYELGEPKVLKFIEADSRDAFNRQMLVWLEKSGYEKSETGWRELTGKPPYSSALGLREDLRIYVKRSSRRSFQAFAIGDPVDAYKHVQIYRAMQVNEYTKKEADRQREAFEDDTRRMRSLFSLAEEL